MKNNHVILQRMARIGVLAALSLILVVVESFIPPLFAWAPGAKIGLGNIVILLAIVTQGYPSALAILLIKCLFGAVYGGNMFGLVYSLSAGAASFAVMSLLYHFLNKRVSIVAISVVGAVVHNTVQTAIAAAVVSTMDYFAMLPFLLIASVIAGLVVGFCVYCVVRTVPVKVLIVRS